MNVAVLGASAKPERYSHQAVVRLMAENHTVFPVNPSLSEIHGIAVYPNLMRIPVPVETVTVYLAAKRSTPLENEFLQLKPRRVIFNPGAENPELMAGLRESGVECVEACTLVLLSTDQF